MELPKRLNQVLREQLGPLIEADGGELEVVSFADDVLTLRLTGAFIGCPGTSYVRESIIEPAIRRVAPDLEVVVR